MTLPRPDRTTHAGTLALVLLVAALVRAAFLFEPVRYDEAFTYMNYAARPSEKIRRMYTTPNNHVLHSLLVRRATRPFADRPMPPTGSLRVPAVVAGLALVGACYVLGRRVAGPDAGLLTAALVACNGHLVHYSVNARGYSIVALCAVLMFVFADRLRTVTTWRRGWLDAIGFGVAAAVGMMTVPTMLYPAVAAGVWLTLAAPGLRGRAVVVTKALSASIVAALATWGFYLPAIRALGIEAFTDNRFVQRLPWDRFVEYAPGHLAGLWPRWTTDVPSPLAWLIVTAAVVGVAWEVSRRRVPMSMIAILVGVAMFVLLRQTAFHRTFVWMLPLVLTSAGVGAAVVMRRAGGDASAMLAAGIVVLTLAGSLTFRGVAGDADTGIAPDLPAAVRTVADDLRAGDRFTAILPADWPARYTLRAAGVGDDPMRRLSASPSPLPTLWVFVDDTQDARQAVSRALHDVAAPPGAYGEAREVHRFERSRLLRLTPSADDAP